MAELLKDRGFSSALIKRLERMHSGSEQLKEQIEKILIKNPNISIAQMFTLLTHRRGQGKSHSSAKNGSELMKKGKRGVGIRRGRATRY